MALAVVGRPIVRDEGPAKVTGAARFTADVPLTGVLWGKCLRSPLPHARIVRIDTSRAARVPGVRAVERGDRGSDRVGAPVEGVAAGEGVA